LAKYEQPIITNNVSIYAEWCPKDDKTDPKSGRNRLTILSYQKALSTWYDVP